MAPNGARIWRLLTGPPIAAAFQRWTENAVLEECTRLPGARGAGSRYEGATAFRFSHLLAPPPPPVWDCLGISGPIEVPGATLRTSYGLVSANVSTTKTGGSSRSICHRADRKRSA